MKLRVLFITFLSLTVFNSCKKEEHNPSTQEKLLGKWKVLKFLAIDESTGAYQRAPYNGTPADYIDYRSDGKAYSYIEGIADTLNYNIVNDQTIVEKDMTLQIRSLTSTDLTKSYFVAGMGYTVVEYFYR